MGYLLEKPFSPLNKLVILFALASALLAFAYSLNEYFDKKLSSKFLINILIPLYLIPLLLIYIDTNFLRTFLVLIFLLIAFSYSAEPLRFKKNPFLGSLCNALGFPILFLLGVNSLSGKAMLLYFIFFLLMLAAQLLHELAHKKQDSISSLMTTTIYLGESKTIKLFRLLLISATLFSFFFSNYLGIAVMLLLLYCEFLIHRNRDYTFLRRKFKLNALIIGVVIIYLLLKASAGP